MTNCNPQIWLAASLQAGHIVYLPPARPSADQPGTLREQLQIADLAARNPWNYADEQDAYQAARRTILHHARRAAR